MLGASYTFMTLVLQVQTEVGSYTAPRRVREGYHWGVALARSRLFVAPDARAVCVALVRGGLGGRRLEGFARVPLTPGALSPSPSGANLQRPEEVRDALRRALDATGRPSAACTLLLPDGVGRLALLALPADADAREFVRFRLAASLPFPSAEAIVDVLPAGNGQVVGAAVRRAVVAEYEQTAASLGLAIERVHLGPLVGLGGLLRSASREVVDVLLGDAAACFAVRRGGAIVVLRNRRRDTASGEGDRLLQEAERVARLAANGHGGAARAVLLTGAEAARLRAEAGLADDGAPSLADTRQWPEAAEAAWLPGLVP
jgi:hypothetical protein